MKKIIYTTLLFFVPLHSYTQYNIGIIGTPVIETFTGFTGTGFQSNPGAGQIDSDNWAITGFSGTLNFGGTQIAGDYARGTTAGAGTGTGGLYNNTSSDMLWIQPGGSDFTPGTLTARYQNNTGSAITSIDVSYEIHCFNDQARSNSFNFSWSTDDLSYNAEASLNYTSTQAANSTIDIQNRTMTIGSLNIPNGGFFYLRWTGNDVSGSGSRDEFGLENISLTGNAAVACSGPPSSVTSGISFSSITGTSLGLNWTNGNGTHRIVVMREGAAITATPSNFTTYTASSVFSNGTPLGGGQYVVYNGSGSATSITGLNPTTTYHVAIYEYNCTAGSEEYLSTLSNNIGDETTVSNTPTIFNLGDIVILGVNANNNPCSGISGEDVISFVSFIDITPGTSIDITDNGWERANANLFGDTEGAYNMTLTGATIPAGTVFTISFPNTGVLAADAANPNWSIIGLPGSSSFNMNSGGDQVFIMRGGTWSDPSGTHNATYTGGIFLFGFNTKTTWAADGTTQQSNLHPDVACANILPTGGATDFIYYNGPTSPVNANVWFNRIGNNANWTTEFNCTNFNTNFTLSNIPIDNSSTLVAIWTGIISPDWFNCQNWDIGRVPSPTIDAVVNATATNPCEIDQASPFAANFSNIATCRNITVDDQTLRLIGGSDELHVYGNLHLLSGTTLLDLDEVGADGTIYLHGNWDNDADEHAFLEGESLVRFVGNVDQNITTLDGVGLEQFYSVQTNKVAGNLNVACSQVYIQNNMDFLNGLVLTSATEELRFAPNATTNNASTASYVQGPCVKETSASASTSFTFPIGKGGILGQLGISTNSFEGERFKAEYFNTIHFDSYNINSSEMDHVSKIEYWDLDDVLDLGTSSNVTLHWGIHSDVLSIPSLRVGHYYTENPFPNNRWESEGNTVTTGNLTAGTVTSNPITTYSPFTLADVVFNGSLPLDLLTYDVIKEGKSAHVLWTVDNEEDHTIYCLERSADGISFETLTTKDGLGTPNTVLNYDWMDHNPLIGINYYRIRILESNDIRYTPIKTLDFEGPDNGLQVYPSPTTDWLTIELNQAPTQKIQLEIFDVLGKKVWSKVVTQKQRHQINTSILTSGTYLLRVKIGSITSLHKQFVKK